MLCSFCLKNNIRNKIVLVGSDLYVCEDELCSFCITEENMKQLVDSNNSVCTDIQSGKNQKELHESINVNDRIDSIQQQKNSGIINEVQYKKFSVFNWLSIPIIKIQSKIMCFLLLHLDIFEIEKSQLLKQVKLEYSIINKLVSIFNMELVNSVCYSFISKLFELSQFISTNKGNSQQFDKRIENCINNFLIKNDSGKLLKCEFTCKLECKICQKILIEKHSDYFISIPFNKSYFKISKNVISYKNECSKCLKLEDISITITKLPKFLILHCEYGCKERIHRFNENLRINKVVYPMLCVIESKFSYPTLDVVERNIDHQQFLSLSNISKLTQSIKSEDNYTIHYKSRSGWYSMSENTPKLCVPSEFINIENDSNIRFLIYGVQSDNELCDFDLPLEDFLHDFELKNQIDLSSFVLNSDKQSGNVINN